MLQSIVKPVSKTGVKNMDVARRLNRSGQTISNWFVGRSEVPQRMRAVLSEAIGAEIDWQEYDAEFAALPPPAPREPRAKPPQPRPVIPRQTAQEGPQQPIRRITATPPSERKPAPVSAAPQPLTAKPGFFSVFFKDAGDLFE